VDKDRIERAGKVRGSVKKGIGKVTGDRRTESEGTAEKTAGRWQSGFGKTKDGRSQRVQEAASWPLQGSSAQPKLGQRSTSTTGMPRADVGAS
jgi:uncharacterized protein YjbJ (UPF0337 family)